MKCDACGENALREVILPEHVEDIGGVTVRIINTVRALKCASCCSGVQTHIPNLRGLVEVVAMTRAMIPIELLPGDLKLMRRALGMKQKEFADAMNVTPETISRWESGARGMGDHSEKDIRIGVCSFLKERNPHVDCNIADIVRMQIRVLQEDEKLPAMTVESVVVKKDGERERVWDMALAA